MVLSLCSVFHNDTIATRCGQAFHPVFVYSVDFGQYNEMTL